MLKGTKSFLPFKVQKSTNQVRNICVCFLLKTNNIQSVIIESTNLRCPHYYVFIWYGDENKREKENTVHLFDEFNVPPLELKINCINGLLGVFHTFYMVWQTKTKKVINNCNARNRLNEAHSFCTFVSKCYLYRSKRLNTKRVEYGWCEMGTEYFMQKPVQEIQWLSYYNWAIP